MQYSAETKITTNTTWQKKKNNNNNNNLTNRNITIITFARAAIQTNAVRLNKILASEVILNKTSRRNTVF